MAKLSDRLLFEIEYPSGTWTAISPDVEDVILSKKRENGQYFYRLTLESEMKLRKAAWDFISDIEVNDHCAALNIRITNGTVTLYEGEFKLNDADFDFSNCVATLKFKTSDEYTCIQQGIKQEVNMLGADGNATLNFTIGAIETKTCPSFGYTHITGLVPVNPPEESSCLDFPDTWALIENHFTNITPHGTGALPPFEADQTTVWARERVSSPTQPPGDGWVSIGTNLWARKPSTTYDITNSTDPPPEESSWHIYYTLDWNENDPIDNGRTLEDLMNYFMQKIGCDLPIVSDFFMINPDFTAPTNDAYTIAQEKLANLLFFQKSDVKRASVSDNATIGNMTLDELFTWFANRMQVFPSLENGNLRLEHITYYLNKPVSLDLTASHYEQWVKRSKRYSYNNDNPRYLKFPQYESTNNPRFDGLQISYDAACSSIENPENSYPSGRFVTDLQTVIDSPDSFSDDGFVVVNALLFDGDYYVDSQDSPITTVYELNAHLAMPNLQDSYWKDYAFQATGYVNGELTVFNSVRPTKRGVPITVPGWCVEDFVEFDPTAKVRTPLGDGEIEKATFSVKNGTVTFELVYSPETTS